MLRVQLICNAIGSLLIDRDDPIDINELILEVRRSEDNDGIVYNVVFDLEFIKASRDFLKTCFESGGGIDSEVVVKIYQRDRNRRRWKIYATGKINWNKRDLLEDRIVVSIEQIGFERRVLNFINKKIDARTPVTENGTVITQLELPELTYHSKRLVKIAEFKPESSTEYQEVSVAIITIPDAILAIDQDVSALFIGLINLATDSQEVEDVFNIPYLWSAFPLSGTVTAGFTSGVADEGDYVDFLANNLDLREPCYEATEAGTVNLDLNLAIRATAFSDNTGGDIDGQLGTFEVYLWLEHRRLDEDEEEFVVSVTNLGKMNTPGSGPDIESGPDGSYQTFSYNVEDIELQPKDKFYVYTTYRFFGEWEGPNTPSADGVVTVGFTIQLNASSSYVRFDTRTIDEEVPVKTAMIYELAERCVQFYTNQTDCFRSTLLGRTDILDVDGNPLYTEDGEASLIGITLGHFLRDTQPFQTIISDEKKMFLSLADILQFINMRFCAGIGFETINGKQYLILEKKEYFFNKDVRILSLGQVYNIKSSVDPKRYWNGIQLGYSGKLDIDQVNAIDEANTVRDYTIPIVSTSNTLKFLSDIKTSGHQIERQKRLRGITKDSNLDDEIFAVSLVRDGITFKTKKIEGYTSVNGVFDSGSGYNYDLTPARALVAWGKYIASCLYKSFDKVVKFNSGDGNYYMTSQKTSEVSIAENGNLDLSSVEPIWVPEIYSFNAPLGLNEIQLIKETPYGYVEFFDQFGERMEGFILNIEHNPTSKLAEIELLKVHRNV
jgi:hypothetical protein